MFRTLRLPVTLITLTVGLMAVSAQAQTIDCDAPAPTQPGSITTGRPYNVSWCAPSTVTVTNPDSTTSTYDYRADGYKASLDGAAEVELGKLTPGAPSTVQKLMPLTYRTTSGVNKGQHNIVVVPWNCPLDPVSGVPMTTCTEAQKQRAAAVTIPFVATDSALPGAPPPIQKGRVTK